MMNLAANHQGRLRGLPLPFFAPVPRFLTVFCVAAGVALSAASCAAHRAPAAFSFFTENGQSVEVTAHSKEAVAGRIDAKEKSTEYEYSLPTAVSVAGNVSFVIDYTVRDAAAHAENAVVMIGFKRSGDLHNGKNEAPLWQLPLDLSFLGIDGEGRRYRYAIPLDEGELAGVTVKADNVSDFLINAFSITTRFYGFEEQADGVRLSPFVYRETNAETQRAEYVVNPSESYTIDGGKSLRIKNLAPNSVIKTRAFGYESSRVEAREVSLPAGILGKTPYPVTVNGEATAVVVAPSPLPEFPVPLTVDTGVILDYPQIVWRHDDYEIFRWESFPKVLIFDTASYEIQSRLFKRLAFFTEKKGYRGKILSDREMANLHGWNAHDYRAEDLAAFFELARQQNFPLLKEERFLQEVLTANGIISVENGSVTAGEGAVVSISRESNGYLRRLFMAHECFHGIYFIDADFRDFTRRRYDALDPVSKRAILSYFDYQSYDITDEYLVFNEFMAHLLQQSAGAAAEYFGKTIPDRLDQSEWRRSVLPQKDEARGTWPHLAASFDQEARAFSAYVSERWPLAAGRVWLIE
jgi:hypothetical protein